MCDCCLVLCSLWGVTAMWRITAANAFRQYVYQEFHWLIVTSSIHCWSEAQRSPLSSHLVSLWNLYGTFTFRNRFRFSDVIYIEFWEQLTSCRATSDIQSCSVQYKRSHVSSFDCFSCYALRLRTSVLSVRRNLKYLTVGYVGLYNCVLIALTKC